MDDGGAEIGDDVGNNAAAGENHLWRVEPDLTEDREGADSYLRAGTVEYGGCRTLVRFLSDAVSML